MPKSSVNSAKVGELYTSIGVDLSTLDADLVYADKTVADAIKDMNAKKRQIKIQAEIDQNKLAGAATEIEKLSAKEKSLNDQLGLQEKKLKLTQAAYQGVLKDGNATAQAQSSWKTRVLEEERAYSSLEAEIRKVQQAKEQESHAVEKSKSLAVITPISQQEKVLNESVMKEKPAQERTIKDRLADIGTGKTTFKQEAIDMAVSSTFLNEALGLPLKTIAKFGVAGIALEQVTKRISEMTLAAIESGARLEDLAQRMNITTDEAKDFMLTMEMGGVDVNDASKFLAKLDKQLLTVGSSGNSTTEAMRTWGFSLTDSAGKLLPLNEQIEQLAQGYTNATKAGEQEEFIDTVLGSKGQALIPVLRDMNDLKSHAKEIEKDKITDPMQAKETEENLRQMNSQWGELKKAAGGALIPLANEIIPTVTRGLKEAQEILKGIYDIMASIGSIAQFKAIDSMVEGMKRIGAAEAEGIKRLVDKTGIPAAMDNMKNAGKQSLISEGIKETDVDWLSENHGIATTAYNYGKWAENLVGITGAQGGSSFVKNNFLQPALEEHQQESDKAAEAQANEKAAILKKQHEETMVQIEEEQYHREHNALENEIHDIETKTNASIKAGMNEADAWQLASEKIATAIKKVDDTVNQGIRDSIYNLTHNQLENAVYAIEQKAKNEEKEGADPWLISDEEVAKKAKVLKDFNNNVVFSMNEVYKSTLQNQLDSIEKQKQAYMDQGASEANATEWAEEKKSKTIQQFEDSTVAQINNAWKNSFEQRLDAIDREKKAFIQAGVDEVKAAEWAERQKTQTMQQGALQMIQSQKDFLQVMKAAYAGQTSGFFGEGMKVYDFKIPVQQRLNMAALEFYRHKYGITEEDRMTPDMYRAFMAAQYYGQNNAVYGMETDQSAVQGTEVPRYSGSMDGSTITMPESVRNIGTNRSAVSAPISIAPQITVKIDQPFVENEENMSKLADRTAGKISETLVPDLQRLLGGAGYG